MNLKLQIVRGAGNWSGQHLTANFYFHANICNFPCSSKGSYRPWKSLKVFEFQKIVFLTRKSWNSDAGPGRFSKSELDYNFFFMCVNALKFFTRFI